MRRIETIAEMKAFCREITRSGRTLGLVPTMGALHEGHLSLTRASKSRCDVTAATIFVNPLQFGPTEDLEKYPRALERDTKLLEELGVDVLFAPAVSEMYPAGAKTYVLVEELSNRLDGGSRPGHFRGVTTVVLKLFEIVRPDFAFFGQKDAAQVAVLRRMVRDLDLDVALEVCPIVRENDGLAMSSRNAYLVSGTETAGAGAASRPVARGGGGCCGREGCDQANCDRQRDDCGGEGGTPRLFRDSRSRLAGAGPYS